jgi:phage-related baseplate assembly protein
MSQAFTAIDLSKLAAPQAVETLSAEAIFQEMLAKLQQLDPGFNALVPSDPAYQILLVAAYRETLLRQTLNDKFKARLLAFATGPDLDHVAASQAVPVERLAGETDDAFRARLVLAPEAYSVAGPIGAYIFHALSAHGNIKDVAAWNPGIGGRVNVAVLSKTGNGACFGVRIDNPAGYADGAVAIAVTDVLSALSNGQELTFEGGAVFTLDADFVAGSTELTGVLAGSLVDGERAGILPFVQDALDPETKLPLCDTVEVMSAEIIEYAVEAQLTLYYGPDAEKIRANATAAVQAYVNAHHACGHDITLSGLHAALHVEGVQEVNLIDPPARVEVEAGEAAFCTAIDVTVSGRDE